ncbi:MAG: hypothetical protein NT159_13980 [Proteobacteria bacterium]|nr:hypothetical protein [Pseudomonadota bacterium]
MKLKAKLIFGVLSASLLAACGNIESASYMIAGAPHSLALTRTKTFLWSDGWDLELVTAHNPECMRRHKLQPVTGADFKVELYRSLEGNYIIKQGNNWYVTETQKCRLQQFQTPPREPGDLLGFFEEKGDGIKFTATPAAAAPLPAPVPAPPAVSPPVTSQPATTPPLAAPLTR